MTGKCPNCGYHFRLRKNGTMGSHRIYGAKVKSGDPYRVAREKQGRVYITDDSYYCEGAGRYPLRETVTV